MILLIYYLVSFIAVAVILWIAGFFNDPVRDVRKASEAQFKATMLIKRAAR